MSTDDIETVIERGRRSVAANSPDGTLPPHDLQDFDDRIVDTVIDVLEFAHASGVEIDVVWVRVAQFTKRIGVTS